MQFFQKHYGLDGKIDHYLLNSNLIKLKPAIILKIVSKDIFNELDRWIPFNINYNRFDINNFNDANFII